MGSMTWICKRNYERYCKMLSLLTTGLWLCQDSTNRKAAATIDANSNTHCRSRSFTLVHVFELKRSWSEVKWAGTFLLSLSKNGRIWANVNLTCLLSNQDRVLLYVPQVLKTHRKMPHTTNKTLYQLPLIVKQASQWRIASIKSPENTTTKAIYLKLTFSVLHFGLLALHFKCEYSAWLENRFDFCALEQRSGSTYVICDHNTWFSQEIWISNGEHKRE